MQYKLTFIEEMITSLSSPTVFAVIAIVCLMMGYCFTKTRSRRVRLLLLAALFFTVFPIPLLDLAKLPFGWDWYGYLISVCQPAFTVVGISTA